MTASLPIPGWFSFREWYDTLAAACPPGSTLVELGVFCGKSLAHLAGGVRGKGCRVVGVDTFRGSPEFAKVVKGPAGESWDDLPTGHLAQMAIGHLTAAGVIDDVTLIVSDSAKAASLFPDQSVFAVMVDAGHDADSVERDARAWWPKVAPGGVIVFDDFDREYPGVREGLLRVFPAENVPDLPPEGVGSNCFFHKI